MNKTLIAICLALTSLTSSAATDTPDEREAEVRSAFEPCDAAKRLTQHKSEGLDGQALYNKMLRELSMYEANFDYEWVSYTKRALSRLHQSNFDIDVMISNVQQQCDARIKQARKPGPRLGMTGKTVIETTNWGEPGRVNRTVTAGGVREQWVFGGGYYLYFTNGRLTAIQD
jgi:hypothetical protein